MALVSEELRFASIIWLSNAVLALVVTIATVLHRNTGLGGLALSGLMITGLIIAAMFGVFVAGQAGPRLSRRLEAAEPMAPEDPALRRGSWLQRWPLAAAVAGGIMLLIAVSVFVPHFTVTELLTEVYAFLAAVFLSASVRVGLIEEGKHVRYYWLRRPGALLTRRLIVVPHHWTNTSGRS